MKKIIYFGVFLILLTVVEGHPINDDEVVDKRSNKTTADRIREFGYPAETHQIETDDNYLITLFRIPYSHKLNNQDEKKPAILLQHGLLSCSDAWIVMGPEISLAFLLADEGYDVWMGNARGNRYSRNNTILSTKHPYFWRFSWHEIALYDISRMIDHILETTSEKSIHYVGHSQGTTVFFVLMSKIPEYNEKIKTAHLLAPVAFMGNMKTLLAKYTRRFVGRPNTLTRILDSQEILPDSEWVLDILKIFCESNPVLAYMCSNIVHIWNGDTFSQRNTNLTAEEILAETHPAGASSTQVLHYMQEYESYRFREFDHGEKKNLKIYGQSTPPDYNVEQITSQTHFYYCDADTLADVTDVEHLATLLGVPPVMFHVPDPEFTHGDFAFSNQVKEVINDRVIAACNAYEAHPTL